MLLLLTMKSKRPIPLFSTSREKNIIFGQNLEIGTLNENLEDLLVAPDL
jgi:hypothetical protein